MKTKLRCLFPLSRAFGVLLTASVLSAHAATVSLSFNNAPSGTITNGLLVPANVIATTDGAPAFVASTLNFRTLAPLCTNLWNSYVLTQTGSDSTSVTFTATLPRLPAGNVDYYASCTYVDEVGVTSTVASATNTYTVGGVLASTRNQTFDLATWTPMNTTGPDYNSVCSDGWTGTMTRIGTFGALCWTNWNGSVNCGWLRNGTNSQGQTGYILSPLLPEGAGTLYFEAAIRNTSASWTNNFKAQVSTNYGASWTDLQSFQITGQTILYPTVSINTRVPSYLRLQRSNNPGDPSGLSAVVLDNIRVSYPPADLQISLPATNAVVPQYPQATDTLTMTCKLQDADTNQATINRRVTLYYNFVATNGTSNGWVSLSMTNVPAVPGQYATTIAPLGAGTNRYYYRCDFDGYYYTNTDKRGPSYLPTNAPAVLFTSVINDVNRRIIRLQADANLGFFQVSTNTTSNLTLRVYNDGNMPLTVTNITFGGAGFSALPTSFVVPMQGTQYVTVTFAPATPGPFSDTLTVLSDMTAGTNTYAASGIGMALEFVSQPTVTGATVGTVWQPLSFSLSVVATDNWGYVVQNSFDWGDGSTSAWDVATSTNHFWSTNGVFSVRAQGRSSTNGNVLSAWSAPISVTITNTRVLALSGNLDFGTVGVKAPTIPRLLSITNSGNGPLTVSNITSTDPTFSAAPTNFVIPAFGSSNVSITFAPTNIENTVTSTITVVSDRTAGQNTTNATGASEQLTMLSLVPPVSSNTLAPATLAFTAAATNSSGHALNYRFDWGDGSTSAWTIATASHGWTNAGTFFVRAQAQCQVDTTAFSTSSAPVSVIITNTRTLALQGTMAFGTVVTNLSAVQVLTVTNSGNGALTVSNITFSNSVFTVSATSFVLPPFGATNVNVTFAPVAPGYYSSTVVVTSDRTSGNNTGVYTGVGEMIGKPTISPTNTAGTLAQLIAFTASATNNTGDGLEYRFDWGDNSTSIWTTATASHAWFAATSFSIRAQARCVTHTSAQSVWSDAASLIITNQRLVGLIGPLAFSGLMTNQSATLTLTVTNSGNASFSVSAVNCPAGFSALPQSFTVPASNSAAVTVTFAPTILGPYTGTVTVVSADMTGGNNTIPVSGFCEMVGAPVLTGVLAGHRGDTLSFGALATNNGSGHAIQYLYSWGDGQTSGWTFASTTSHMWTATNAYPVRVQAQCVSDTNVISVWSQPYVVNIYEPPLFAFSTVTNGLPFQVTMTATGAAPGTVSNCVFYYLPPMSTNAQPTNLTFISGNDWKATIPPLDSGDMGYYLQYMRSGIPLRYPAISNNTFTITNFLGFVQQVGFEAGETWTLNGGVANYNYVGPSGWTGTMMRVAADSGTLRLPGINDTPMAMWLRNGTNSLGGLAYIQSPLLPAGVGTVYFEVGLRTVGWSASFSVQVSVDTGTTWTTYYTNYVDSATILHPVVPMNIRQPAIVRIQRTSNNLFDPSGLSALVLDNIIISPPPTDVLITEVLHNPGYPNSKDPVLIRCQTTDYDPVHEPSVNRRLTVTWHHETEPAGMWTTTNMYAIAANVYEGVIPVYLPGVMSYYFRCDFDGYYYTNTVITNSIYVSTSFTSENLSPSYLPDQRPGPFLGRYPAPTAPYLTYTIRFFRSQDETMTLQTTPSSVSTAMELVDDYTWQGLTLMKGITNLTWYFVGTKPYTNNALAFGPTLTWGDTNQDFPYPPMGGIADLGTNIPLRAAMEYDGFLVYKFATSATPTFTNFEYLVKRAVYQNFDNWQASQDYFEESIGLYAAKIFTNDFSAWSLDSYPVNTMWRIEDFAAEAIPSAWFGTPHLTINWWACEQATVVVDRAYQPLPAPNRALLLNNNLSAPGRVWNSSRAITEGLHNFAFRTRLAQNDGRYAVYTKDLATLDSTAWASSYRVTNTVRAISMSPGSASVSLLLCYRRDLSDPYDMGSYYEFRLTQVSDGSTSDSSLRAQLFRWNNGLPTVQVKDFGAVNNPVQQLTDPNPLQIDLAWTNIPGYGMQFTGRVFRAGAAAPVFVWATNNCEDRDLFRLQTGGSVGILCSDAEAEVRALDVYATVGTGLDLGAKIPMVGFNAADFSPGSWFFGGKRVTDNQNWWQTNVAGSVGYLTRPLPPVKPRISLYSIRTGTSGTRDPDLNFWTNSAAPISVNSFSYANVSQPFNLWDQTYVMLQYTNGDLPVIVDDLTLDPWRGITRGQVNSQDASVANVTFWDWTSPSQQNAWSQTETGFAIFEGLITNSAGNTYASLVRSRANPSLSQGLWTPILSNGVGSLAFQATVGTGTSVYQIESASIADLTAWTIVAIYTNTSADGAVNRFVPVRQPNITGRIRVVQLPTVLGASNNWVAGSSPDAVLNIDNLVARDYPPPDDTTWKAYNCLIARPATNNNTADKAFETAASAFDHQTCYLNNGVTNNVISPEILDRDNPYVQTPKVATGIGEIAFWYRAWDTKPAYVSIRVAPNENVPPAQWTVITNFVATNLTYQYFRMTPFDTDDQVMRIYTQTNTTLTNVTGRLCIDNVLMTEPVRAGFDITSVTLQPVQPLASDTVGVQATVGRFLMNPQNIRLFLSYTIGTNTWGYRNWWGSGLTPTAGVATVELSNTADRVYTAMGTNVIPKRTIDDVVQYVVWGTYTNMVGRPFFEATNTFVNPSWYYPVDLNTNFAARGWSPYYYVYSCPPGSVWINEVDPALTTAERTNEYVELIGPANANLGKWTINLYDTSLANYDTCTISNNFVLANTYNNWGFFVYGDVGVPHVNQTFATPLINNIKSAGGVRLIRSMGAWEDAVCWSSSLASYGFTWVGFTKNPAFASLSLSGGGSNAVAKTNFFWYQPSSGFYTPGLPNKDQTLGVATPIPTGANYTLTSVIGLFGSSSLNGTNAFTAVQVAIGGSTTVVYTAASWYRVGTMLSNGSSVGVPTNATQYTWAVTNMTQNISNNVSFYILPDAQNGQGVPTFWLAGFGRTEATPFDNDAFGTLQEYLLNMNPYVSNAVNFAVDSIAKTGATLNVTVKLLESTNGVAFAPQQSIYGTLAVEGTTNLTSGIWTSVVSTQVAPPGTVFDGTGRKVFSFPADTNKFYRAKIQ